MKGTTSTINEGNNRQYGLREQQAQWKKGTECALLGIHALISLWHKSVQVDGDYVQRYRCFRNISMYTV